MHMSQKMLHKARESRLEVQEGRGRMHAWSDPKSQVGGGGVRKRKVQILMVRTSSK